MYSLPIGIRLLRRLPFRYSAITRLTLYKSSVLILTFLAYMAYHLSRRPLSIVKNVLNMNCKDMIPPPGIDSNVTCWCCWAPFNGTDAKSQLAFLDSCFLFSYAFFMFFSGFIAERIHLRYFLSIGMISSGIFSYLFGIAYYYDIHNLYYFVVIQIFAGAFQTTGWPAVVAAVGHWFPPESKRGLIYGIWNSHTNIGNILGAVIAGAFVDTNWGLSFIVPSIIITVIGLLHFLVLVPYPEEVGLVSTERHNEADVESLSAGSNDSTTYGPVTHTKTTASQRRPVSRPDQADVNTDNTEESPLMASSSHTNETAISFIDALKIPGVLEFSFSLFFCKLVSYTFLYWLPKYIDESTGKSASRSAFESIKFDTGGIVGAIGAGILADKSSAPGLTCVAMLFFTIPMLQVFLKYANDGPIQNLILQFILGALVNGPYALITTAVSADLGSKVPNSKAMATVTSIIDGIGSIGAAVGPLIAGLISNSGWQSVFYMVIVSDIISLLWLVRISIGEAKKLWFSN